MEAPDVNAALIAGRIPRQIVYRPNTRQPSRDATWSPVPT